MSSDDNAHNRAGQDAAVHVRNLTITYTSRGGKGHPTTVVSGVGLDVAQGESYGLVGESGSGKTTTVMALTRYLPDTAHVTADVLKVGGVDVLNLDRRALRDFRASGLAVVYQEPGLALNPTMRIGRQVAEVHRRRGSSPEAAHRHAIDGLSRVQLPDPATLANRYPHELSGGQQQRVVIAMALAAEPALLLLDEPTTGLDSRTETEIMLLLDKLRDELGFASILISHNLPLIAAHCTQIGVLRDGKLVEEGTATDVLQAPRSNYTRAMLAATPRFDTRREYSQTSAAAANAAAVASEFPLLSVDHVTKRFGNVVSLDDVSLILRKGEVLGIVGESGSGKTTLGRTIAGLVRPDDGTVTVQHGSGDVPAVQVVFQNPDASLNPRRSVRRVLTRAITLLGGTQTIEELAESTGISAELFDKLPAQLSGGQKQRVAIARAFAGRSPLIVCDEPTSALDVSIQSQVLDLLTELQERTQVSYLFISHDLAVIQQMSHRVGVMHDGQLIELGKVNDVFNSPSHPVTAALIDSALSLRRTPEGRSPSGAGRTPRQTPPFPSSTGAHS